MIDIDFRKTGFTNDDLATIQPKIQESFQKVITKTSDFSGWVDLPNKISQSDEFAQISELSDKIRTENANLTLLFIGIGGSYLGAKSTIDALGATEGVKVLYAGNHMSNKELAKTYEAAAKSENLFCVVISKSGTTLEPAFAFHIFEQLITEKYETDASNHIIAITDGEEGVLHDLARAKNYQTFIVPDNIGGRYSIFTPVGLLPIALACGPETIKDLITGATEAQENLKNPDFTQNTAMQYAALRNLFLKNNKSIEILATFEPSLNSVSEWWKQLFGESEGKDNKGLFPASMVFSTDLHSLGQFVQQGTRNLFETFINFTNLPNEANLPLQKSIENLDNLNYLENKTLSYIQRAAFKATTEAHAEGGAPNLTLTLQDLDAKNLGYFYYFMEFSCAISAYTLGVNPFNQPGVEAYKQKMFQILEK
ncbi:MAG: glucose-6-phosphate isomerase [Candidatus Nomurabacteria bacterium]|jgi:glucose-6-phosphate isomerase|nr:glucose-6-phosphate isomerase [Candidatus Nomurabacteria bacterium]